jgi:cytoskeletal protein CcmA (bactofilin family)
MSASKRWPTNLSAEGAALMAARRNPPKDVDPLQQEMQGVIGEGATLSGEIHLEGGYRVDGRVAGRLSCSATVIVGPPGVLEIEELHAGSLVVAGEVRGNLQIRDRLEVSPGGRVYANVALGGPGFVLAKGAIFEGTLSMQPPEETQPSEEG